MRKNWGKRKEMKKKTIELRKIRIRGLGFLNLTYNARTETQVCWIKGVGNDGIHCDPKGGFRSFRNSSQLRVGVKEGFVCHDQPVNSKRVGWTSLTAP